MTKKRKRYKKNYKFQGAQGKRKPAKKEIKRSSPLLNEILTFFFKKQIPLSISEVFQNFSDKFSSKKEAHSLILELLNKKDLLPAGKKRFQLNKNADIYSARLEKHPRGFGFASNLLPKRDEKVFKKDPFISIKRAGTANHGDTILIKILQVRRDGRPEAEIISILKRFSDSIVGFFKPGTPNLVEPEDPRFPSSIVIQEPVDQEIAQNDVVLVEIIPSPPRQGRPVGKVIEVFGSPENIDVQMKMVIAQHKLPHLFSPRALKEAESCDKLAGDIADREDLRDILHFTIDGETAKDFDDAVAVLKKRNGFRLYVSIADVSHYVRPGSQLDKEAYTRGTSIYFPGRVIPMLPEKLSNNLCSLVPDEDRLTFTAILDFDRQGNRKKKHFCRSIIRSHKRFTYTTVHEIVTLKNAGVRREHKPFLTPLKWCNELAELLLAKRMERGSLGFNLPEPEIYLDQNGKIESIKRKTRNFSHQIIEEFMLAANEAVAETFSKNEEKEDFVYRIHEKPEPEKVAEFSAFAKTLGLDLPPLAIEPSWFANIIAEVKGSKTEYVINNLLLRTMQQARYDSANQGHFGLAATDYTHFTSPIRRYPDLLVHRLLAEHLANIKKNAINQKKQVLKEKCIHLSARERVAVTAERDINERLKLFYMENYIGKMFEAIISGVTEQGLYIELTDLFISGLIDIASLRDDYYLYDPKRLRLIGEISGKSLQLGMHIQVITASVDHQKKKIFFNLVPEEREDFYSKAERR